MDGTGETLVKRERSRDGKGERSRHLAPCNIKSNIGFVKLKIVLFKIIEEKKAGEKAKMVSFRLMFLLSLVNVTTDIEFVRLNVRCTFLH